MANVWKVRDALKAARKLGWRVEQVNRGSEWKFFTPKGVIVTGKGTGKVKICCAMLAKVLDEFTQRAAELEQEKRRARKAEAGSAVVKELKAREDKAYGEGVRNGRTGVIDLVASAWDAVGWEESHDDTTGEIVGLSAEWKAGKYTASVDFHASELNVAHVEDGVFFTLNGDSNPDEWLERAENRMRMHFLERVALGEIG